MILGTMKPHLLYAWYIARHKAFVFRAGLRTHAPLWRLVIHDWSKLTPAEWGPYVNKFYGNWGSVDSLGEADRVKARVDAAFDAAWLHHIHNNPHHWQHWVLKEDSGGTKYLPMPYKFVCEMVADWMGAGRAITGKWDVMGWYERNAKRIQLHPKTRKQVEGLLRSVT